MSYKTTIPNPGDFLAISQKQLLANYLAIYAAFSKNHVTLDSNSNTPGLHTYFTIPRITVDPATTTTQIALYSKLDGSSVPQLFLRPSNNGTPIQMTNSNVTFTEPTNENRQSTFVPGPFTVYTGFKADAVDGDIITLTPNTTLFYVALISATLTSNQAIATNITGNQFTINLSGGLPSPKRTVYYNAIGLS